jgi:hygromycin-B 7''-O-kinase
MVFLQGPVPEGPDVILTGEYTPFNLLHQGGGLSALFDFGDGLVGPREYDWLGPMCFLAAGTRRASTRSSTATTAVPFRSQPA